MFTNIIEKFTKTKEQVIKKVKSPIIATVEEIHAEFDSGEQRILDECDALLAELKIPTETQIEKKADLMVQLGFVNSETVKQASVLKEKTREIEQKIKITATQAETIRYFKQKYPFEKFITTEELDRICNKYNLIHAPVANYIKDIPEKNVLEMTNCKKLDNYDKKEKSILITNFEFWKGASQEYKNFIKNNLLNKEFIINSITLEHESDFSYFITKLGFIGNKGSEYWFRKINGNSIDKSGLFIAAPQSHFNLDNLSKESKYGFFEVKHFEVKDPVVFNYCREGIVRIISKWGDDKDIAYLDPILQNEVLN